MWGGQMLFPESVRCVDRVPGGRIESMAHHDGSIRLGAPIGTRLSCQAFEYARTAASRTGRVDVDHASGRKRRTRGTTVG